MKKAILSVLTIGSIFGLFTFNLFKHFQTKKHRKIREKQQEYKYQVKNWEDEGGAVVVEKEVEIKDNGKKKKKKIRKKVNK